MFLVGCGNDRKNLAFPRCTNNLKRIERRKDFKVSFSFRVVIKTMPCDMNVKKI